MVQVKIDLTQLKNELTIVYNELNEVRDTTDGNKRRDVVLKTLEKLRTLQSGLNGDYVTTEVK